jgi:hypothetical protein
MTGPMIWRDDTAGLDFHRSHVAGRGHRRLAQAIAAEVMALVVMAAGIVALAHRAPHVARELAENSAG